jgi:hypothetical protein
MSRLHVVSISLVVTALIVAGLPAHAQDPPSATLTGTVTNAETGAPLPGVHVFLSQSMKGTVTDSAGHYRLRNLPRSRARLVGSRVGFRPVQRAVQIRERRTYTVDLALKPTVVAGEEIVIEDERDEEAMQRMRRFRRRFLGVSAVAQSAEIVNPEVLRFEEQENTLTVRATEPIVIDHSVLGYRIRYTLREFIAKGEVAQYSGEPLFEPMTPKTPAQQDRWERYRRRVYDGSFMHFVRAATRGECDAEDFRVISAMGRARVDCADLFESHPGPHVVRLPLDYGLRIVFDGREASTVTPNDPPILVDTRGRLVRPYAVVFRGAMGKTGVADLLPLEYTVNGGDQG